MMDWKKFRKLCSELAGMIHTKGDNVTKGDVFEG